MAFDLLINLKGVQVRIPFETLDDLQAKLSSIDFGRLDEVLAATFGDLALETPEVKPGLEEIYVRDRTGLPQLCRLETNVVFGWNRSGPASFRSCLGSFWASMRFRTVGRGRSIGFVCLRSDEQVGFCVYQFF